MQVGPFQILIIALVLLVLFGRGRISEAMGDVGKGVKSFRKSLSDEEPALPAASIEGPLPEGEAAGQVQPASDPSS